MRLRLYYEGVFADGVRYPGSAFPSLIAGRWKCHEAGKTKVVARYMKEHNIPAPSDWEILFAYDPRTHPDGERIGYLIGLAESKKYMHSPGLPLTVEASRKGGASLTLEQRIEISRKGGSAHSKEYMIELNRKSYTSMTPEQKSIQSGARLSPYQVQEIRKRLATGEFHRIIAEDYPATRRCITKINNGRIYAWVEEEV